MDRLKAIAVFVRIAECGSMTAAAHALGQSTASVVRSLAGLERHLGVRLVNRTTRRLALTEEGREYLAWCRQILSEFDMMEEQLDTRRQSPGGLLRLTAPVELGTRYVVPLVNAFLHAHPAMRVELLLLDRIVNLLEEKLDLAVRIGQLADSATIATTVGHTRVVICASPAFLDGRPELAHPSELMRTACIVLTPHARRWEFRAAGQPLTIKPHARVETNQVAAALSASLDGLGVTRLFHYQVAAHLASGQLVRLMPDFELDDIPIQLVYPHSQLVPARVRHFLNWITPRLGTVLPVPG